MTDRVFIQGQLRGHCIRKGWVLPRPGDLTELAWAREGVVESAEQKASREKREWEVLWA